ncbi:MAG: alpha/beta fold hydrolase [Chitinophagaceae bacterium]
MKNLSILSLIVITIMSSCKKECNEINGKRIIPSVATKFNNKTIEISNTLGSSASIVLVGGFGSELKTWQNLYSILPNNASIFSYNRAGIGNSENVDGSRDAIGIAKEMRAILAANNVKPPYVLVAHSMGGVYARMFYHLHPNLVKGIVLVDATHENQLDSLLSHVPATDRSMILAQMAAANDAELQAMQNGSLKEEFRANFATNYQQIRQYNAIKNIPIYVVTSTKVTADNPAFVVDIHKELHEQWAMAAGLNGRFIATSNSEHYIHVDEPGLVAEGVRWILSK